MNQFSQSVPSTDKQVSKTDICDKINDDIMFKEFLKAYKNSKTSGQILEIGNDYKNGLSKYCYLITDENNNLLTVIMPVFSSEKTITWDIRYIKDIMKALPATYSKITEAELNNIIVCPLYKYDRILDDVVYMQGVKLTDWQENGYKGKNGYSVYFLNDKLPNPWHLTAKKIRSDIFVKLLPTYSNKELKDVCIQYATKFHKRFADISVRSEQTKIKNIADGLYAQFKTYLWLVNNGYDVSMEFLDGDDLGIDITYHINGVDINIDVKSTKTTDLKISKNRKETHFYAVCSWSKNKVEPQLLGFLFKYNFWKSEIINTTAPEKKNDMYIKSLKDISKDLVKIENVFDIYHNYSILKMKRGQRLFNAE